jgi:hypothetical protein
MLIDIHCSLASLHDVNQDDYSSIVSQTCYRPGRHRHQDSWILTLFSYDDLHSELHHSIGKSFLVSSPITWNLLVQVTRSRTSRWEPPSLTRFSHNLQLVVIRMRVVNTSSLSSSNNNNNNNMGNQQKTKVGAPKIPRGLRRLPVASSSPTSNVRSEYDRLQAEAAQIEQWWSSPRWQDTKRVYSGTYRYE